MEFQSEHNLDFEVAPWEICGDFQRFKIGTCTGLWCAAENSYCILAVVNESPGNGHFNDVLQWFENSCVRDGKAFVILEVWNEALKEHLITKRGFQAIEGGHVEKEFTKNTRNPS